MSSIRDTWRQHKASTIYLTSVILWSLLAVLAGFPALSVTWSTTGFMCAVAIVIVEHVINRSYTEPEPAPLVMPGQDAFQLADRLNRGHGMEAVDVIFGGSYGTPERVAQLLEQTAVVLRVKK